MKETQILTRRAHRNTYVTRFHVETPGVHSSPHRLQSTQTIGIGTANPSPIFIARAASPPGSRELAQVRVGRRSGLVAFDLFEDLRELERRLGNSAAVHGVY